MQNFDGKVAVISGAGSGIGRALAQTLNAAGCALEISDVDEAGLAETRMMLSRGELGCDCEKVDVSDRIAMERWAANVDTRRGRADIVVNNAGVALDGSAEDNSIEDIEWLMGINFWGVVYGCKVFLPLLRKAESAHLINISSILGIISGPNLSAYNAAKFAIRGYTEALRQEMEGTSVNVCCVHPGGVQTNLVRTSRTNRTETEAAAFSARFDELAKTSSASAAEQIMSAISKHKKRVLIGRDAKLMALISRLFPVSYPKVLSLFVDLDM